MTYRVKVIIRGGQWPVVWAWCFQLGEIIPGLSIVGHRLSAPVWQG